MPLMWPRKLPPDVLDNPLRSTEVRVYRSLERTLDPSWHVYYSRPWLGLTGTGEEKDGECDFVVAHSQHGLLCLEVKGGGVAWDPVTGQWTSRDRWGIVHRIKDPVAQARTAKHEILGRLRTTRGHGPGRIRAAHGVVLPDSARPADDLGPDRPLTIFCFADTFERRFGEWVTGRLAAGAGEVHARELGEDGMQVLQDLLARPFVLQIPLGIVLGVEDREISSLTQQQYHLVEAIGGLGRVLIQGGAGTGKTVLASHLARLLAAEGRRTLLVCYNEPLAQQLAASLRGVAGLRVHSFHQLCGLVLRQAGVELDRGARDPASFFSEDLPDAALAHVGDASVQRYDAVVVDEGQDFTELWWLVLEGLLDPAGPGLLRVFADDNQRLYGDMTRLSRNLALAPIRLSWNLRNTRCIHEVAYRHYEGGHVSCPGPDGEPPRAISVAGEEEIPGAVQTLVGSLVTSESIKAEDIVVLVPDRAWRDRIAPGSRVAGRRAVDAGARRQGCVTVDTVRRFKGLEALVAVIVAGPELASSDELAYVSLSRSRTRSFLVGLERHIAGALSGSQRGSAGGSGGQ